jgi:hypothetical protein
MSTLRLTTISNQGGTASVPSDTVINGSAKAWVNFNGTGTVAIRQAFNVSSITDNANGDYTVNFTTALPDTNYNAVFGVGSQIAAQGRIIMEQHDNVLRSTTQLRIYTLNTGTTPSDSGVVSVSIFR